MRVKLIFVVVLVLLSAIVMVGCGLVDDGSGEDGGGEDSSETDSQGDDPDLGTLIITQNTVPPGQAGTFQYTGVPTGTISTDSTLVVSNLSPGTYTSTERDPAPDFDVTAVECDDGGSPTPSSGDPSSRTAVFNLDPGETITCNFTNTQRGSAVVAGRTVPEGGIGNIQFTGVPTGTIPANGTLVVANLQPGTYTSTERDPTPDFDLTAVECDDGGSPTPSGGDPSSRSAIFNIDPGEMVTCTFINTQRGSLVITSKTVPEDSSGNIQFTGVPTGTISANGTLVVADLTPGTYTSTERDPAPDFELTAVECDDGDSPTPSSGDPSTRTAVFNLDPGETVNCTFTNTAPEAISDDGTPVAGGSPGDGNGNGDGNGDGIGGENPFLNPDVDLENFPLPEDLPPDAGTYATPRPGPWSVTHYAGQMDCGLTLLDIPASPPESGVIEVLDEGETIIGTGLQDAQGVSITMTADPAYMGRYTGAFQGQEQGVPVTINYLWQLVTDEHIIGYLTSSFTSEGVTCTVYRPYEMFYDG